MLVELEFGDVCFVERGNPGYLGKALGA